MAGLKVAFAFLLVIFTFGQGSAENCELSSIKIQTAKTGRVVEGNPEFKVVISNTCHCAQSDLILRCLGFSSVETVDPAIFKQLNPEDCLINNGKPIVQGHPISFTFAWKTPFDLFPKSSRISC